MTTITETTTTAAALTQHSIVQMASRQIPHGLGLLTTVASLPPKYRSRYLNLKAKSETPLDLTLKPSSPVPSISTSRGDTSSDNNSKNSTPTAEIANDVPMASTFTEVYTETRGDDGNERTTVVPTQVFSDTSEVSLLPISASGVYLVQDSSAAAAPTTVLEDDEAIVTITQISKPITPPLTPTKRKHAVMMYDEDEPNDGRAEQVLTIVKPPKKSVVHAAAAAAARENPAKHAKTKDAAVQQKPPPITNATTKTKRDCTPTKPIKSTDTAPKTVKAQPPAAKLVRNKATRKLKFDEETSSPVSGTIIRPLEDITDGNVHYSNGDIDPKYNIVEITEETKAELAAIKNVIGDYICKLCRLKFDDAFGLARHRCACIVLLEYRCPECGKQFNCPANLASHRRWHKPKKTDAAAANSSTSSSRKENRNTNTGATQASSSKHTNTQQQSTELPYPCDLCGKRFKRAAYLRKHQQTHNKRRTTSTSSSTTSTSVAGHENAALIADGSLSTASTVVIGGGVGVGGGSYQSYAGSTSSISSSLHSFAGNTNEEEHISYVHSATANGAYIAYAGDDADADDDDVRSTTSSVISQSGYGRLQIVETGLTEEENIAAAALTNLRNCASVIQHTTLAH